MILCADCGGAWESGATIVGPTEADGKAEVLYVCRTCWGVMTDARELQEASDEVLDTARTVAMLDNGEGALAVKLNRYDEVRERLRAKHR